MPREQRNWARDAEDDARHTVDEFEDEIVEQLVRDGEASDDLGNDYSGGDRYHHETHVDKEYSLMEAAEVLDQLSEHEETDSGLWEGLPPRDAVSAQAAYTYGNAVYEEWRELIRTINEAALGREVTEGQARRIVRAVAAGKAPPKPEGPKEWTPRRRED